MCLLLWIQEILKGFFYHWRRSQKNQLNLHHFGQRYWSSCSNTVAHAMKLLAHRFCADVNTRGGCSADVESADFHASGLSDPALQGFVVCHFIGWVAQLTVSSGLKKSTNWLVATAASCYGNTLGFSDLFRTTFSFTSVCKGRLHGLPEDLSI